MAVTPTKIAEHHAQAAQHHEKAAEHHKEAAKHYGTGAVERAPITRRLRRAMPCMPSITTPMKPRRLMPSITPASRNNAFRP